MAHEFMFDYSCDCIFLYGMKVYLMYHRRML